MRLRLAAAILAGGVLTGTTPGTAHAVGTPILAIPLSTGLGFVPNVIYAQEDGTVLFVNLDAAPHNVTHNCRGVEGCETLFATPTIPLSGTATIEWYGPVEVGQTYNFNCTVPGHEQTMQGTLTIVD